MGLRCGCLIFLVIERIQPGLGRLFRLELKQTELVQRTVEPKDIAFLLPIYKEFRERGEGRERLVSITEKTWKKEAKGEHGVNEREGVEGIKDNNIKN